MGLLANIQGVMFKRPTGDNSRPFEYYHPKDMNTGQLGIKIRYHMKQVLACLLEMKERELDICGILSKETLTYKECKIKYDTNNVKMLLELSGQEETPKKKDKRKCK